MKMWFLIIYSHVEAHVVGDLEKEFFSVAVLTVNT